MKCTTAVQCNGSCIAQGQSLVVSVTCEVFCNSCCIPENAKAAAALGGHELWLWKLLIAGEVPQEPPEREQKVGPGKSAGTNGSYPTEMFPGNICSSSWICRGGSLLFLLPFPTDWAITSAPIHSSSYGFCKTKSPGICGLWRVEPTMCKCTEDLVWTPLAVACSQRWSEWPWSSRRLLF